MIPIRLLPAAALLLVGLLVAHAEETCVPREPLLEAVKQHPGTAEYAELMPGQLAAAISKVEEMSANDVEEADFGVLILHHDGFLVFGIGHDGQLCRTFLISPGAMQEFLTAVFGRSA